jgi:citrate lyase subunit beta/citryl-CoA lyase
MFMSDFGQNVNRAMSKLAAARSLLFTPGNDEYKLAKALAAGADVVVADLEDAVPAAEKASARTTVARLLTETAPDSLVAVRLNGAETPYWQDDLDAVTSLEVDAIVIPKATPEAVVALGPEGAPVLALVETAHGLRRAYETASSPRVAALVLGAVDLGLELRLEQRPDGQELLLARSQLVLDSAAARIRAPFDAVHVDTRDSSGLEEECRLARTLGFRGKACFHPAQVEIVNRVFSPSKEELRRARRVVAAYEHGAREGKGAVALDGELVDLPVAERARQVLADAERSASDGN